MLKICAIEYVSLSELGTVMPWINKEWIDENTDTFKQMLWDLGMDSLNYPVEEQYNTHRNRFNNIITTYRWVGKSRLDQEWVNGPYSSTEAKDKSLDNSLLTDLYRSKGMVEIE